MFRPRHIIIGFSGYARTGKDVCSNYLVDNYGAIHTGLSDPAKRHIMDVYGFTEDQVFGDAKDDVDWRTGLKPRVLLQDHMKLLQDHYEPTWIEKGIEDHKKLADVLVYGHMREYCFRYLYGRTTGVIPIPYDPLTGPHFEFEKPIITTFSDIRHFHDVNGVKKVDSDTKAAEVVEEVPHITGAVVRIKRPGIDEPPFDHRSETEQATIPDDEFHFIVDNDSTIEDLGQKMASVMTYLLKFGIPEIPIFL